MSDRDHTTKATRRRTTPAQSDQGLTLVAFPPDGRERLLLAAKLLLDWLDESIKAEKKAARAAARQAGKPTD